MSPSPTATCARPFQRDRDRIVHSKAFRRLKHKTQVFIAPEGDHYRTRLTHTLETCGIARTVARALGLNEDLTEAIGYGHDLGHPPFGHIGEEVLDEALRSTPAARSSTTGTRCGWWTSSSATATGLNLTEAVRDGILHHTGSEQPMSLEGRVVRLVDRVAYINHDIDDAIRAGILLPGDLPEDEIRLLGPDRHGADRHAGARPRRAARARPATSSRATRWAGRCCGCASSCSSGCTWGRRRAPSTSGCGERCTGLFEHYLAHPEDVPDGAPGADDVQRITDWIAGMTDRFCIATFRRLALPEESRL